MSKFMSVRATQPGIYKNRRLDRGEVFVVEAEFFSPVWMEELQAESQVVPAPVPEAAPAPAKEAEPSEERRAEERDPGEHEQHIAEERGIA